MPFLARLAVAWLLNAVALWLADRLFDGVAIDGWGPLLLAALVLGVLSAILKPVLLILSIPLILVTLGLFILVINVALLALTDWIVGGFDIGGFWTYLGTVVLVWLVNAVLSSVFDLDR